MPEGAEARAGLRLALSTLTVLRLRPVRGTPSREAWGWAMTAAPAVGLGLGVVAALALRAGRFALHFQESLLPAVVAVATLAFLTRGLHLDGLADTADGLGAALGREDTGERSLTVMRRGDIGAFGVVTLLLNLMLQITALDFCVISERGTQAVVLSVVCGRLAMSVACRRSVPAARPAGLGAQVAGTVPGHRAALLVVLVALQALAWGSLDNHAGVAGAVRAAIAVAVSLAVAEVVVRRARRRLGGITGDVLGAACELSMTSTLIVMAVTVGPQLRR